MACGPLSCDNFASAWLGGYVVQWETQTVLTQLTQQPPPEVLAATQGGGDNDTQAEIWQVGVCVCGWESN